MMDSSDGLARSLHQIAAASDAGAAVAWEAVPVAGAVRDLFAAGGERREAALFFGEDFELVFAVPEDAVEAAREASPTPISVLGHVTAAGVTMDGEALPDRGYGHGTGSDGRDDDG